MNPTRDAAGRTGLTTDLAELLQRYSDAWHRHDLDAIMSMHTDDTVFHLHNGNGAAVGATQVREAFQLVLALYPDLSATQTAVEIGETHTLVQSVMRSSATDSVVEAEAVDVFRFVDGLISRKDTYLDTAALAG
jgi:ketosteroid isomerase-like protein